MQLFVEDFFPSIKTVPDVGFSRPAMIRNRVVFPHPEEPLIMVNDLFGNVASNSENRWIPPGMDFERLSRRI